MSGSPKYSHAEIEERRLREIEERVRLEAQLAHQRRVAEEARLLRVQLEQTRLVVLNSVRSLTPLAERAAYGVFAQHLPAAFSRLGALIASAETTVATATNATSLATAARHVESISLAVQQMIASAKELHRRAALDAQRNQLRPQIEITILRVGTLLTGLARDTRKQHDLAGFESVEQRLSKIKQEVDAGDLKSALELAQALVPEVQRHAALVAERRATWAAERDSLRERANELTVKLDALSRDEVTMAWVALEFQQLRQEQQELLSAVESNDFQRVRAGCSNMETQLASAVARAQSRQLEAEKRQYIVDGLVKVLRSQGFAVAPPELANENDFGSTVLVHAMRPDHRAIDVQIPMSGRVEYDVDGYARRVERQQDGAFTTSCEEAEERLERLHHQLAEDFGIQMDELTWDLKEPLRKERNAQSLPTGDVTNRSSGGKS